MSLDLEIDIADTAKVIAFIVARKPVAAIDACIAEAAQLLATEAERRHDRKLQVVVRVVIAHRHAIAPYTVVLLRPVQVGSHAQPFVDVILTGNA